MFSLYILLTTLFTFEILATCEVVFSLTDGLETAKMQPKTTLLISEINELDKEINILEIKKDDLTTEKNTLPMMGKYFGYGHLAKNNFAANKDKKLSEAEKKQVSQIEKEIDELTELMLAKDDALKDIITTIEKPAVLSRIKKFARASERNDQIKYDYMIDAYIRALKVKSNFQFISLLFSADPKSKHGSEIASQVIDVINRYKEFDDIIFLVDADTTIGKDILAMSELRTIGLSAVKHDIKNNVYKMDNSHLKLQLFLKSKDVFTDAYSLTGLGLQFMTGINKSVSVINGSSKYLSPVKWSKDTISKGLGIVALQVKQVTSVATHKISYIKSFASKKFPLKLNPPKINDFSFDTLVEMEQNLLWFRRGEFLLDGVRGAAIFGSSKNDIPYGEYTYDLSNVLSSYGVEIVTGGSGGMMVAANMGGIHGGAKSIGIPVAFGSKLSLSNEKEAFSEYHTDTVFANGYDTRVPFLINNRDYIGFVPGGSGTMRELAASLIQIEADQRNKITPAKMLFASPENDYYKSLEKVFKSHAGTVSLFADHFFWISSPTKIVKILPTGSEKLKKSKNKRKKLTKLFDDLAPKVTDYEYDLDDWY